MSSRDVRGSSNRGIKILSREERDRESERSREGRDRDRDRRRDRDRDDRDRERRKERTEASGKIVLLKRPDARSSSGGGPTAAGDRLNEQRSVPASSEAQASKSGPTLILQRSAKRENEGSDPNERGKVTGPPPITEILKPAYQFPGGRAIKLIDSNLKLCSWKSFDYDANNYAGNMDYLVVTAIGRPGVGKSSILSYLAGNEDFGARKIFPPRSREEEMQSSIYITSDQIVFIEMSSVFNQSASSELVSLVAQQGVLELSNVTWNLRLVRWALSISHVILVISENVYEPSVFQLMNSAEIVHPMDSALGEGSYPEPIYICNKANLELLDNKGMVEEFQKYFTSISFGRAPRISSNYFVLPHAKYDTEQDQFLRFKNSILEFSRYNRAPFAADKEGLAKLSQKNSIQDWFQNAARLWDEMNSASYFSSYAKLLP